MYNAGKIIAGLIVFVSIAAFPFYYNLGRANARPEPKLDTPVINSMEKKECVEPAAYMRAEHMRLLNNWRRTAHMRLINDWKDSAAPGGEGVYVSSRGKKYAMSLQQTCMNCHSNKKKFCDECHNYVAVKPYCWDCHIAPEEDAS